MTTMQLTMEQRGTLRELVDMRIKLCVLGVEKGTGLPCVWISDTKRQFPMVIHTDGRGLDPTMPIRPFVQDELLALQERDADILLAMRVADEEDLTMNPDLLREIWYE